MIANFAGTPSITIPYTKVDGLPFGINITTKQFEDQKMFNIALTLEESLGGQNE
jgi:aspartyl-tRNA(Asn)/glutamyl-tRNA(Gln) amidotransferase subunit A